MHKTIEQNILLKTPFDWKCPHCQQHATITDAYYQDCLMELPENKNGQLSMFVRVIRCPNGKCKDIVIYSTIGKISKTVGMHGAQRPVSSNEDEKIALNVYKRTLVSQLNIQMGKEVFFHSKLIYPDRNKGMIVPDYVPTEIKNTYEESCLIKDLSPKASATLSRRCLQGMIRDFWNISKGRLVDEINELKGKIEPSIWDAIENVRKIGNIGAHMEKDVNTIIDVDPEEAGYLIGLNELLIEEWYIAKHDREERIEKVKNIKK